MTKHVRRARVRSMWSVAASTAMVAAALAFVPTAPAGAASGDLTLAKSGDTSVLVDSPIGYDLTVHNAGTSREYNISFRDVLPVGVTYVPGSTSRPQGLGDPQIVTIGTAPATQQVLIWSNVSDLPAGADQTLSFKATPDPAAYPVGSTVTNAGDVYAQSDPRMVPKFDGAGEPKTGSYTDSASSTPFNTSISAISIAKSENSPEHELLRGIHDDTATYTLKVTNNAYKPTDGNTVVDYLPAGLEFLGCGGTDNGSTREYGGRDLAGTPAPGGTCETPVSVDTVELASGNAQGLKPGVYTKVTWSLPDLAAGDTWTTDYRAGIPQHENTMDFGAGGTPSKTSLDQAANLDNNTGADTREQSSAAGSEDGEVGLTNLAQVSGSYTGDIEGNPTDKTVLDSSSVRVTAEDLAMQKSVSPSKFVQGGVATYSLEVETSEYTSASGVTITDVIPDGLCPLKAGTTDTCATSGGSDFTATNASVQSVTHNADNTWTVVFAPFDQDAQKRLTITYQALMRPAYDGHGGDPTVSGDGYTNDVSLVGSTTTLDDVNAPDGGDVTIDEVRDASSATITSEGPSVSKTIMKQESPYDCTTGTYTDNATTPKDDDALRFRVGDRVCFTLRVDFSGGNSTKNPVVTDFLPDDVAYEAGSATATGANNVTVAGGAPDVDGNQLTWTLGDLVGADDRFVNKGGVFEWRLSAIVTAEPDAAPKPDITANLAKLLWTDTNNTVGFLRDQVDFSVGATPPVGITKSHTNPAGGVIGGAQVPYSIEVTNQGSAANDNDIPIKNVAVRDLLPTGVDCSLISAISDGGSCSNGVIDWTLAGPLAAGASTTVTYTMTIPNDPRVLTTYVNTTGVVSYDTTNNLGDPVTHHPDNPNTDLTECGGIPLPACDVPAAQDDDTVTVENTGLTKTQVTAIGEANNSAAAQAVIGEQVTYTVKATVRAHTTVYQGVISDPMPAGMELLSATADRDGTVLPTAGASFAVNTKDDAGADSATITLPPTYTNSTNTDQVFTITVVARVTTAVANTEGMTLINRASFSRKDAPTGGSDLAGQTASSNTFVIEPSPRITKSHTPTQKVSGNQTLTYTLTTVNAASRPTLYDAYVVDCVPAGLDDITVTTTPPGTTVDAVVNGNGANGCATGTQVLRWHIPSILSGDSYTLKYTVVVDPTSAGGQTYTNTAVLTGSSLKDNTEVTTPIEREYSISDTDDATVVGSALTKSSSTPLVTVGDRAQFTVTATVPADVNYYDATIVDTLPSGLDPTAVTLERSTCTYPDASTCSLTATPLTSSGQKIGWFLGDLTADAKQRTIALTYSVPVQDLVAVKAGHPLTNSALLGWDLTNKTDPTGVSTTPDQNSGTATSTDHVVEPKVSLTKAVSTSTPAPGDSFTYTVTATNDNGTDTSDAHQVTITDQVPTGVVVNSGTISDGGQLTGADPVTGGGTITWTLATLAKPTAKVLTYDATLASPVIPGTLTNTATVTAYCSVAYTPLIDGSCADQGGREYTGPSASADVSAAVPHVSVAKSAVGGKLAYLGKSKSFQVTMTSDGTSKALRVLAVDTLPANWSYDADSARVSVAGATATAVEPTISGQKLTWGEFPELAVGKTIVITYSATPKDPDAATDPGVGDNVNHTNTVAVTARDANGKTSDKSGNPFNGPDASAVTHIDSADLLITKAPVGTPVAGRDFSWTLTVKNNGPDTAVGPITVTDPMPAQLTSLSATGTGWNCSVAGQTITCTRSDSLASGASFPVITVKGHVPVTLADGAHLDNTATVDGTTYDPDKTNNDDESDVQAVTQADMTVAKALSGSLVAGQDATYTLDVTNNGPSVHRGPLVVTDDVPAGTTFVSASGANWTCTTPAVGATGTISCTRSDEIPIGGTDQITVVVHVDSGRTAAVVNTVNVKGDNPGGTTDPDHTNDDDTVTKSPDTSADLSIDKSRVDDSDFVAGQTAEYLLTVHNEGPSDAQSVKITDTLPSYLSYQGFTSVDGSWTCSNSGQDVTCSLTGAMTATPGDNSHDLAVRIKVGIADDHRGDIANSATVGSTTPDPVPGNNTDTDDLTDGGVNADLSITKGHPAGDVVAGGADVTYTLTVTNNGDSKHLAADGPITVTDDMPAGMTCISVTGGTCASASKGTFSYTGDLAVGGTFNVTVVAHVAADAGPATLVNTAQVAGPKDLNPTNDTAIDSTTVIDQANVSIKKVVTGANPVRAGETTTFELTATNDGPSDADDVVVTDTLPAGMSLVDLSGTGWTCDQPTLTCTRSTLAAGTSKSITVTVRIASGVADGASLTNKAHVSTSTDGDDPADNDAQAKVDVIAEADLALHKAHVGGSDVVAGTDTSYTLEVHNAGPSDAQGPITITDTLPTGMSYLSANSDWSCSAAGQVVTCTQPGPLLAGADTTTLTMLVHVDADADVTAPATNAADVTSATTDPTPADNHDEATVDIGRGTDLSIVKSHSGPGIIGGQVDFTLAVHNAGPSTARSVTVTDPLPTGLDYVSADGDADWTCAYDDPSRTVTCGHNGPIAANADAPDIHVVVAVQPAAYPGVTNVATVDTSTPDSDPSNNTSEDPVEVPSQADLSIVKTHTGDLVVGKRTTYTLTVHNDGPTEAAGTVTVTDRLPTGLSFVSASGPGWVCLNPSGAVACSRAGLAAGATSAVTVVVQVGARAYPSVTNTATVSAPDTDPDPVDNSSDDPAPVTPTVRLGIAKSVAYQRGRTIGWDIAVTNHGPSDTVSPIVVTDRLPAQLSFVSAGGKGWTCARVSATVTCTRNATLAVDRTSTVRIATTVRGSAGAIVRNVATVTGGTSDADASSPTAEAHATAKVSASNSGSGLPSTGGPAWWWLPSAALLLLGGALLVRRRRIA